MIYLLLSVRQSHFDVRERLTVLDDRKNVGSRTQEGLEERFKLQVVRIAQQFKSSGYFEPNSKLDPDQHEYLQRIFKHQLSKSRMDGSTSAADQNHVYTYRTKDDRSSRRI